MDAAMTHSTSRSGTATRPKTARASVMLWATVKAVMILKSERGRPPRSTEPEETPLLAGGPASGERDARLPRLGREGQLADLPARLDLGERVVIGAENVEQIVADGQRPNVGRAGEGHDERHAVGLGAPGID